MNKQFNKLSKGDNIYATLTIDGRTVVSVNDNNFASMRDVISNVVRMAGKFVGMARLLVRNQTEGWNITMPLASNTAAPRVSRSPRIQRAPMTADGQLLIPW